MSSPRHKRREDFLKEKEIKAKADLAELEHSGGGFLGMNMLMPKKGQVMGVLARQKVLEESDRPIEYDGLISGRRGSAVMVIILIALAGLILVNMASRYL